MKAWMALPIAALAWSAVVSAFHGVWAGFVLVCLMLVGLHTTCRWAWVAAREWKAEYTRRTGRVPFA